MAQVESKTFGEKLQSVNKATLFAILFLATSVPLLFEGIKIPNKPEESTIDLYAELMKLPEHSTVLMASDWTISTRGESGAEFDAVMRIMMRRHLRAAIYTTADPQAPQVARDTIAQLNLERKKKNEPTYEQWNDYVILGFYPNAENTAVSIGTNIRSAFAGKKAVPPGGTPTDVFQSPVLKDIHAVADIPLTIILTASSTSTITIERLFGKVPLAMLVTGVMGPETQVYYSSGQLVGLAKGLKGAYDMETMMEEGVNFPDYDHAKVKSEKYKDTPIPGFPGETNLGRASVYYPTLHVALILLIVAVITGNVGMALSRKKAA